MNINKPESDVIYYNILINNSTTNVIQANYSEQRTIPLLYNPAEYYMSIIRFSVTGFSIPIFVMPVTTLTPPLTTPYTVTLAYNDGTDITIIKKDVIFYPRDTFDTLTTPVNPQDPYYFVYEYQHFIDLINLAYQNALADLITATGGGASPITTAIAPYFIFDAQTQLISLVATTTFYQIPLTSINTYSPALPSGKIGIYCNSDLFNYIQGLPVIHQAQGSALGTDYWLLITDEKNNWYNPPYLAPATPPNYLIMTEQFNTLNNWNSFTSLAFLSNSLPTLKEFSPQVNVQNIGNTQSGANTIPILTDFVPLLQFAGDQRGDFVYNPTGPYRLVNLMTNTPIYAVDLNVVWFDQYNRQYPVLLEPGQSISLKIMFVKKSSYRYPYN